MEGSHGEERRADKDSMTQTVTVWLTWGEREVAPSQSLCILSSCHVSFIIQIRENGCFKITHAGNQTAESLNELNRKTRAHQVFLRRVNAAMWFLFFFFLLTSHRLGWRQKRGRTLRSTVAPCRGLNSHRLPLIGEELERMHGREHAEPN